VAQSVTVASSTAAFSQVVPDVYTINGSDTNHPPQTGTQLTVCPDGSTSPSPASFQFQEGEVAGTVSVPATSQLQASAVTLDLYTGGSTGGTPQPLMVTCPAPPSNCTTGNFSAFVALGSKYTLQASMTGLTTATATTPVLTKSSPADTTIALDLLATPREVDLTVTSGGNPSLPMAAGTVTLTLSSGKPYSGNPKTYHGTIVNGVAQIPGVAPAPNDYNIVVTDGPITASDTVTVPIGTGAVMKTVQAQFGEITGTVILSPAPNNTTTVTATVCDGSTGCTSPILVQTISVDTSGTATYTLQLPPSSPNGDVVTFSAAKYGAQPTTALSVTDGGTTQAPTITLTAIPPSTTTTT
jgi:hypothetical protein